MGHAARILSPESALGVWRLLPNLYLILAAVAGSIFLVCQPPGQTPDAYSHFYRAGELATGQLIGQRLSSISAGGHVPGHMQVLTDRLLPITVNPRARITWHDLAVIGHTAVSSRPAEVSNSNTAIYPPQFYVPQALGIDIALLFGRSVLFAYEAAVVLNGLAAVFISYLALRLARIGRFWLFTVLCLPMTLAEYFSISQDALLVAFSALVFGVLSSSMLQRPGDRPSRGSASYRIRYNRWIAGSYVALTAVNMSRPVYLSLLALPLVIPPPCGSEPGPRSRSRIAEFVRCRSRALLALLISVAAIGVWTLLDGLYVYSVLPRPRVKPHAQLLLVLQHPLRDLTIAVRTLSANGVYYVHSFEGLLAWASLILPAWTYVLLTVALLLALVVGDPLEAGAGRTKLLPLAGRTLSVATVVVLGIAFVEGAELLTWTPLGSTVIQGVQGRYFLPLAPFVALLLPLRPRLIRAAQPVVFALMPLLLLPPVLASGVTLLRRYYIGA